jgi:hypothetical protein
MTKKNCVPSSRTYKKSFIPKKLRPDITGHYVKFDNDSESKEVVDTAIKNAKKIKILNKTS